MAYHPDDRPGSLADPAVAERRQAMLTAPHMRALTEYVQILSGMGRGYVPSFDPMDGGTNAKLLFLLEKPGPRCIPPAGSGFVSRNTADPTAGALHRFLEEAEVPPAGIVIWNTVPWWSGAIALTAEEKRAGSAEIPALAALLPHLRGAMLVGNQAWQWGAPSLERLGLRLFRSVHMSQQARIGPASREAWLQLPRTWRAAWQAIC